MVYFVWYDNHMRHAVIVHGFKGTPDTNWKPWLKHELETKGINVDVPTMPNTNKPLLSEWMSSLASVVGMPDSETYLIGHSLGCITILQYLQTLPEGQKINAAVLVAGFGQRFDKYNGEHDSFFETELDWQVIKNRCEKFIVIHSKDDRNVEVKQSVFLRDNLNAELILVNNMGHFGSADNVFEIQVVRDLFANIE
jgi:predicted alpha/beta hydrolase family esterase